MGKPSKRKNPGVGVDFRKVKHKVGKKLPKAQNDTKTDFQSRSINLPNQSLTQDKAGAAVSERNLTLKELVAQLSHHNTHTRRDALNGLQQLLTAHPAEGRRHTALLLEALATRVADGEQSVRTALLSLLRTAALPAVGATALTPFVPIFMAHLSAALTHLSADVRLDALAVLEALTEAAPHLLATDSWLCSSLAHYTGLLSRTNRGKSVKSQALTGLLKVISSLERFLQTALAAAAAVRAAPAAAAEAAASRVEAAVAGAAAAAPGDSGSSSSPAGPLFAFRSAAPPPASMQLPAATELLRLYTTDTVINSVIASGSNSSNQHKSSTQLQQQQQQGSGKSQAGSDQAAAAAAALGGSAAQLQGQSLQLLSVLFDCWSEAAPATLSTAPEQEGVQVLVHILSCCQLLLSHVAPTTRMAAAAAAGPDPAAATADGSTSGMTTSGLGGLSPSRLCPGFNTLSNDKTLWLNQAASTVLLRLLKVFPAVAPASNVSGVLQELLQRFNLLSVQLLSGFMAGGVVWPPVATSSISGQSGRGSSSSSKAAMAAQQDWQERLLQFMADVLTTGSCLPASALSTLQQQQQQPAAQPTTSKPNNSTIGSAKKQQQQQQRQAAAAAAAIAGKVAASGSGSSSSSSSSSHVLIVLQSLQQLLPQLAPGPRQQLLAAVEELLAAPHLTAAQHAELIAAVGGRGSTVAVQQPTAKPYVTGAVRTACQQLQVQLLLRYLYDAVPDPMQEAAVSSWIAAAPKLLWECGTARPHVSQLLLQMLYHAGRLAQPGSLVLQQLQQVQPQFAALLATAVPGGSAQQGKKRKQQQQQQQQQGAGDSLAAAAAAAAVQVLVGPLAGLPAVVQSLAVDALCFQPDLQAPLLKAVALSCRLTCYSSAAVVRLLDSVLSAASHSIAPDQYLSFVATLLSAPPSGGYINRATRNNITANFCRHQQVVDSVCRWLHSYGPLQELLQLLTPAVVQQQQQLVASSSSSTDGHFALRCSSYSCACLAALAVGSWAPANSSTSSSRSHYNNNHLAAAAANAAELIPPQLRELLPSVLTAYCTTTVAANASKVAAAATVAQGSKLAEVTSSAPQAVSFTPEGLAGGDTTSQHVAAVDGCLPVVLPLLVAVPELLLPFLLQFLGCFIGADGGRSSSSGGAACVARLGADAGVAVAVHVVRSVLAQQALKGPLMQHEQQLVGLLAAAGQQLQQQGADANVLAELQKVQTAFALLCGH